MIHLVSWKLCLLFFLENIVQLDRKTNLRLCLLVTPRPRLDSQNRGIIRERMKKISVLLVSSSFGVTNFGKHTSMHFSPEDMGDNGCYKNSQILSTILHKWSGQVHLHYASTILAANMKVSAQLWNHSRNLEILQVHIYAKEERKKNKEMQKETEEMKTYICIDT